MENLLALAKKAAEEAEVFMVSSEDTPVQFETNRLKHVQSRQSTGVSLRIIKGGRIGYATATNLDDREGLARMAVETAEFGMAANFQFPPPTAYPQIEVYDPDVESVPTDRMAGMGEELISKVRGHTPDIICQAGVSKGISTVRIINSRGGQVSYKGSYFGLSLFGTLIRGTDMLFVGDGMSSSHPIAEPDTIAGRVIRQLELARNLAEAPTKSMPVIFTPDGVASALVAPLMSAFNGKMVLEGASPLGKKLGQKVFDEKLVLADDPLIAYRPTSRPFDDEGVPSQRTPLIENGVVKNFLYDLQTAARAGTKSTGSGQRGGGRLPSPSPSAFVFTAGSTSFDDMVSDIKEGLVIEELMGAEQGNILGGDFSGNVLLGYKIENGKIIGRVKNTMVSGNVYRMLDNIAAIGGDARWVGGFLYTPSFYFSSVPVASK